MKLIEEYKRMLVLSKKIALLPIIIFSISLIVNCLLISNIKYVWFDEALTYYPASIPNFFDMLSFITDSINAGSWLYFIATWFWSKIFSANILSLRLFSSIGIIIGVVATWAGLKKIYGNRSATLATLITFSSSPLILYQNSEARFYGLFIALTGLLLFITIQYKDKINPSAKIKLQLFLINGTLPLIHLFGFVYSAIFILGVFTNDWIRKKIRWWYYFYSLSGWILFIPFIPAFQKATELSKPYFWIPTPDTLGIINLYMNEKKIFIIFFIIFIACILFKSHGKEKKDSNDLLLKILSALFISFPILIYIYSLFFTSLFIPRYMIIFIFGFTIMFAHLFSKILPKKPSVFFTGLYFTIISILIIIPIHDGLKKNKEVVWEHPILSDNILLPNIPIVSDSTFYYLPRQYYNNPHQRDYYFVLDWKSSIAPHSIANAAQDFTAMTSFEKHLQEQYILTTEEVLENFDSFIVVVDPGRLWFEMYIKNNNNYTHTKILHSVYLVTKKI